MKIDIANQERAETEAAIYSIGTPFSKTDLFNEWITACNEEGDVVSCQHVYERMLREHPEFQERWLEVGYLYDYATDSESGEILAINFDDACSKLDDMISEEAIDDGAWGWVRNAETGERYKLGIVP